jgi:site-specific recombinase XerD
MEEELIQVNPMANVKKPKLPNKIVKGLESEIIITLLNAFSGRSFNDLRNKAMLLMFLDTGLRLSELAGLTLSDINIEKGIIKIIGKGNKERYARIGVKTQKALWNYLAHRPVEKEYVWLGKGYGKMTKDGIALMVRNLGKRLGMKLSPHKLRHSFAISFLRNGANPFELQIALGHTTLEMTKDGIALMVRNLGKRLGMKLSPHKLRHSFAISFLRNGANPFELQIALGHTTLEMTRRYTQALGFDDVFKRHVMASPVDRLGK